MKSLPNPNNKTGHRTVLDSSFRVDNNPVISGSLFRVHQRLRTRSFIDPRTASVPARLQNQKVNMRTATILTVLLPVALSGVIPATEDVSPALSLDKRQDAALQGSGGNTLQADVLAVVASFNQQKYQLTKQPAQWKTCNSRNIIVRREWSVARLLRLNTC